MPRIEILVLMAALFTTLGCQTLPLQGSRSSSIVPYRLVTASPNGRLSIAVDLLSSKLPRRSPGSCLLFEVRDGQVLPDGVEGSPIVDELGEVVAVYTDKLGDGESPSFMASPVSRALASINRAKGHFGESVLTKDLSTMPNGVDLRVGDRIAFGLNFGASAEHSTTIATISCMAGNLAVAHGPGPPTRRKLPLSLWGRVMYVAYRANVVGISPGPQVREIYEFGAPVGTVVFVDPQTIVLAPGLIPKRLSCEFSYRLGQGYARTQSTAVPANNPLLVPVVAKSVAFFLYHCPIPTQANVSFVLQVDGKEPRVSKTFETNRFGQAQLWLEKSVKKMLGENLKVPSTKIRIDVTCEAIGRS